MSKNCISYNGINCSPRGFLHHYNYRHIEILAIISLRSDAASTLYVKKKSKLVDG